MTLRSIRWCIWLMFFVALGCGSRSPRTFQGTWAVEKAVSSRISTWSTDELNGMLSTQIVIEGNTTLWKTSRGVFKGVLNNDESNSEFKVSGYEEGQNPVQGLKDWGLKPVQNSIQVSVKGGPPFILFYLEMDNRMFTGFDGGYFLLVKVDGR